MSSNRSKPFSGKKKKEQLQLKKQIKNQKLKQENQDELKDGNKNIINLKSKWDLVGASNLKPQNNPAYQNEIISLDKSWRNISFETVFGAGSSSLTIPIRPEWNYNLSKDDLEESETKYFESWMKEMYEKVPDRDMLSFFEHNLEVWRQLWRVCEISDLLVIVADIRNPIVHLPPSFYDYVTRTLKKPLLITLTKSDLVSENLRNEWARYLNQNFQDVKVHFLSTFDVSNKIETKNKKRYVNATGVIGLLEDIKLFCHQSSNHISQLEKLILSINYRRDQSPDSKSPQDINDDKLFTIGFIGQPNVGKSSLINSIFGKKVVSASKTPGHTKHLQTMHLTSGIRVCDCPGLVFPSIIDKNLQILSGIYNIAQVKDPYGPIFYLAQRIDLFKVLKINRSSDTTSSSSIFYICEEFAKKSGFFTSKAGRPDIYRAANFILRQVIDGKILISWAPPGFEEKLLLSDSKFSELESDSDEFDNESQISLEELMEEKANFLCNSRFSVLDEDF